MRGVYTTNKKKEENVMSYPGKGRICDDAVDQAIADAKKRGLSEDDKGFDDFVNQRADQIIGELPDSIPHDYEEYICSCGEPVEKCSDAYEHMTHGV